MASEIEKHQVVMLGQKNRGREDVAPVGAPSVKDKNGAGSFSRRRHEPALERNPVFTQEVEWFELRSETPRTDVQGRLGNFEDQTGGKITPKNEHKNQEKRQGP